MGVDIEIGKLVEAVAKATQSSADMVWFDINSVGQRERALAVAVWPLVKARYHGKSKPLAEWLSDAYGCFCAFSSIASYAEEDGLDSLKALMMAATVSGNIEALASESDMKKQNAEARASARSAQFAMRDAEIERVFEVLNVPTSSGRRPNLTEIYPLVAAHINEMGWPDGNGGTVKPKKPITANLIEDILQRLINK